MSAYSEIHIPQIFVFDPAARTIAVRDGQALRTVADVKLENGVTITGLTIWSATGKTARAGAAGADDDLKASRDPQSTLWTWSIVNPQPAPMSSNDNDVRVLSESTLANCGSPHGPLWPVLLRRSSLQANELRWRADRARLTILKIADVPYDEASRLLTEGGPVRLAILMHLRNISRSGVEEN